MPETAPTPATATPNPSSPSSTPSPSASASVPPTSSPPEDTAVASAFVESEDGDDNAFDDAFLKGLEDEPTPSVEPAAPAAQPTAAPVAPAKTPSEPAATPAAAPAATPAATAQPAVAPEAAPVPAAAPPAAQPASEQPAPTQAAPAAQDYVAQRRQQVDRLAAETYKLSDEDAEALDTTPSKALPRLAAQLHMQVLESAVAAVAQYLPRLIEEHSANKTASQKLEDKFTSMFPALKDHMEKVVPIARAYRQLNPTEEIDKVMKAVGEIAHNTLGIAREAAAPAATPTAAPRAQPLPPFQPPVGGAPRASGTATPSKNPYEMLAMDGEQDEE